MRAHNVYVNLIKLGYSPKNAVRGRPRLLTEHIRKVRVSSHPVTHFLVKNQEKTSQQMCENVEAC